MRARFTLSNATDISGLTQRLRHDAGIVAYLNGNQIPVASSNAATDASTLGYDSAGVNHEDNEVIAIREFVLSASDYTLNPGVNVFAVNGLNQASSSSDALWKWELVGELRSLGLNGNQNYFFSPSPLDTKGAGLRNPGAVF